MTHTYDPTLSDPAAWAAFAADCGAPDAAGLALSQPCSPNKCAGSPWAVGPWSVCSADCAADSVPPSGVLTGLRTRTVACFDAAGQCVGTRPEEYAPCAAVCDVCAAVEPCGTGGGCRYALRFAALVAIQRWVQSS